MLRACNPVTTHVPFISPIGLQCLPSTHGSVNIPSGFPQRSSTPETAKRDVHGTGGGRRLGQAWKPRWIHNVTYLETSAAQWRFIEKERRQGIGGIIYRSNM